MLSEEERQSVHDFFADGLLDRIEGERGFPSPPDVRSANAWIFRFNSLGIVAPVIRRIWEDWWKLDHTGKAVCAVMYASGLVYLKGENPIYGTWTPVDGGGGPYLTETDSPMFDWAWRDENLAFLRKKLSVDYVIQKLDEAASTLSDGRESAVAARVAGDARKRTDVVEIRIGDLFEGLSSVHRKKVRWE